MSKVILTAQYLTDIADAIRRKNHQTASYTPSQMAPAIDALEGDTVVQGAGPWTITVTNPTHTYITSTPEAFIAPKGGAYSPRLRTKENIVMDTGYLPGRILKSADAQTNVISVTAEPATEIEGMINDGWALVYMDENGYYYSDSACSQLLTVLTGKVAVAGMPGGESEDLNQVGIGPSLEYRNDFTQSVRFNMAFNEALVSCSFKNLTTAGDSLLSGCSALTSVRFAAADDLFPLFSRMNTNNTRRLSTLILARDSVMLFENASSYISPSCNIYVPSSLVAAYEAHPHWLMFPNIQAMTEGM